MENKNKTYFLLVIATAFWGIQPLCIKLLVTKWTPVTITCARYFVISGILFFILYLRKDKGLFPPQKCLFPLILMGIMGIAINNIAQFTGLQYSTIINCTLISATSPAITAFLSAICIKERLNGIQWMGIGISFAGVLCIISHGSLTFILHSEFNRGDILFFICQLSWTLYSIIGLKVMHQISALAATAWAGFFGATFTALYGLIVEEVHFLPLFVPAVAAFMYTVICGGVLAMLFWNMGVKDAGPSLTAIFQNITPVVGVIGGTIFFNEIIGRADIVGAIGIFAGVYLTMHSNKVQEYLARCWLKKSI
ncbi:Permease of the drug/metabolite transporter (DMT) superfamily [Propionispira arboris]|uniref:Permease of the drug/metabolite transporter (DMT) superfamily n=1 Tax=Propionispira arboris TaxID=84035 RepID=A0A1H6TDQ8_9FIRM|nr:DMT family transporter [Propionispira arboris]SEI78131.1 Permease of the drug/metabolite transporter (DMT) superfamily [Propionispira arboris]